MSHTIERAKSGRAACRKCKEKIAKDELRFGHLVESQFGETLQWYHLKCAAERIPVDLERSLKDYMGEVPDREKIDQLIVENRKNQKPTQLPYAEHAPSGRSSCMVCREKIEKGDIRIAVEREIDAGAFSRTGAGYLHPHCVSDSDALPDDAMDQIAENTTSLEKDELEDLYDQLQ